MSGHCNPLTCCDRDCAAVNGCREGGYMCARCGRWFCATEIDEDNLCEDCAAEAAKEREEEEEGEEEQ